MKDVQEALLPNLGCCLAFPRAPLLSGRIQSEHPTVIECQDPSSNDVDGTFNLLSDLLQGEIAVLQDRDSLLPQSLVIGLAPLEERCVVLCAHESDNGRRIAT